MFFFFLLDLQYCGMKNSIYVSNLPTKNLMRKQANDASN